LLPINVETVKYYIAKQIDRLATGYKIIKNIIALDHYHDREGEKLFSSTLFTQI